MPKKAKLGELPCPACKEPCSGEAIVCPHCRTSFTAEQIADRKKISSGATKATAIGCVGLIALVLLIATCSPNDDDKGSANSQVAATANAKADAIALYRSVISATSECDAAAKGMSPALNAGDVVAAYRAADRTESACLGTRTAIGQIDIPDSLGSKGQAAAKQAIEACQATYLNKWSGAGALKKILDGDARPSAIAEMQDTAEIVQAGTLACAGGLMSVAMEAGATAEEIGIDTKGR